MSHVQMKGGYIPELSARAGTASTQQTKPNRSCDGVGNRIYNSLIW